ncbi:Hypothetical predicted protein [Xyrichtys novacula]|uniref:Uncharacterized protein n=1 Tax=Xyrichtys novacula TaxID=13765 RepID=A0AAV1GWY2_XYRNO|nr:Hypothetical predicted protein [Xyrichtys novacula]
MAAVCLKSGVLGGGKKISAPREGLLGLGTVGGSKLGGGRLGVMEVRRLLSVGGAASSSMVVRLLGPEVSALSQ